MIKKDLRQLETILYHALRARHYLDQADVGIVHYGGLATTSLHFTRASDGYVAYPVNKQIGSDIAGLDFAIAGLRAMIERPVPCYAREEVIQ